MWKRVFLSRRGHAGERPGLLGPFVIFEELGELEHVLTWSPDKILSCYSQISGVCGEVGSPPRHTEGLCGEAQGCTEYIYRVLVA